MRLLTLAGARPTLVDLDPKSKTGNARRAELGRITGRSSVPSIWVGGEYVGGCDDGPTPEAPGVVDMAFTGALRQKLEALGALPTAQAAGAPAAPAAPAAPEALEATPTPPPESVSDEAEYVEAMASAPEAEVPAAAPAAAPARAESEGKVVPAPPSAAAKPEKPEEPAAAGVVPAGFTEGGLF